MFQCRRVGKPCSYPRTQVAATPSSSRPPSATGRPSHRAASDRSRWEWATTTVVTGAAGVATPAVVALMFAVDRSTELGWGSALVLSLLAVAAGFGVAFVLTQLLHHRVGGIAALGTGIFALAFGVALAAGFGTYSVKRLRTALSERSVGVVEIKKRGVDIDPAQLRRQLRPTAIPV